MRQHTLFLIAVALWGLSSTRVAGRDRPELERSLKRIFDARDYESKTFGPARWLGDGDGYTTVEPSASIEGSRDIVRYDTSSGERVVLVSAEDRIPPGANSPLEVDDYDWSADGTKLLLFTNSERVWRNNTRGDYWVVDLESDSFRKLGGVAPVSSLMFAKFSPDGTRVGYVMKGDVYVEDVSTGEVTPITSSGSATTINGTSDWVYEEEFGLRDAFRFSPDGRRIALWNFDATGVGSFTLINNTDDIYPRLIDIPYPKAGTTNSAVRIGIVSAFGGETTWMDVPGDPRDTYLARMEWADDDHVVMQHLNRLQNTNDVLLGSATTGAVERVHRDRNESWVEVNSRMEWLGEGDELVWLSESDGYRHAYAIPRAGGEPRLITDFEGDVIAPVRLDADGRWFYFLASPEDATERYLYRSLVSGGAPPERLTPASSRGTHGYDVSPNGGWAFHTHSSFDEPPVVELVELPGHRVVRTLEDNDELREAIADIVAPPVEMFRIEIEPGVELDAWMLKPPDFEPSKRYPLLVYVYGEPAGQTVLNRWFGSRTLFHRAIAAEGFIVVSVDNRGTPAPRGAPWRKVVYGTVGDLSSRDQAAALRALTQERSYIDPARVAIWGWSGGGSNTLNAMFRFPDLFHVGISVAPVPDQRLYDTIYQERYMGLPQDNVEGYRLGSPIHFAEGLKGKLLLIHGTGDDNVHYQGTELLVDRLIELGKPFDFMAYPNRSHAIREGEGTTLHLHSLIARYLMDTGWVD